MSHVTGVNVLGLENTTTTPLGGGGVFTGGWEEVTGFAEIRFAWEADTAPAASSGVLLEFSADGVTAFRSINVTPKIVTGQSTYGGVHTLAPIARYFRVKYTNGAGAQSSFFTQTFFSASTSGGLVSRANQTLATEQDVRLVRAVNSPELDRNIGTLSDFSVVRKFGRNAAVAASEESIWEAGGDYTFPSTAEPLRIASGGNGGDTAAGAGAREITVVYLDSNWDEVTETLATAGAAASATTANPAFRLIRAFVSQSGTYHDTNAGDIVIEQETSGIVLGQITAGLGQTQLGMFSVRAGWTAYITRILASVGTADSATVKMFITEGVDVVAAPFGAPRLRWSVEDVSGATSYELASYIRIPEKSDIELRAQRVTGQGQAQVSIAYDLILVRN